MITVYRPRMRPRDRQFSLGDKSGTQQIVEYPAPTGGWNTAAIQAGRPGQTALVMDNVIPRTNGVSPRAGCKAIFNMPDDSNPTGDQVIKTIIGFKLTGETFAATDTGFYAFDENSIPVEDEGEGYVQVIHSGQTSSDYSTVEMQTDAGKFLTLVNGVDDALIYDGTTWTSMNATTSDAAYQITGVDTNRWSYGWVFQNRQYFIEKEGLNAWYLGTNSISGVATKLPLSGVFSKSSELLFGASFSTDSGSGIDDYNVFVSKEGEVAIFAGISPEDASSWSLKGLFEIGRPLGKNAHFTVAGDLIIGTVDGLVPLSSALEKDVSQLKLFSLSAAIEPDLNLEVQLSRPYAGARWRLTKSDYHDLGFIVLPRRGQAEKYLFVVNMKNQAWCRFTGWTVRDLIAINNNVFFTDGKRVYQGLVTGRDNGAIIEHHFNTAFDNFGLEGRKKSVHRAKLNLLTSADVSMNLRLSCDYEVPLPTFPKATNTLDFSDARWGEAVWDSDTWPDYVRPYYSQVTEISQHDLCDVAAFQVTFASDSTEPLDCKVTALSLAFTPGQIF